MERISKWRVPTGRHVTTDQQHNAAIAQLTHVMQRLRRNVARRRRPNQPRASST
ncbi:hypothetical protein COLINT_02286 [Collinsella intestinalis DSM 13280]|uniref:Uncharacterized protein n=1 Tax=Collinsella intestinalis DSM 13280 TaxID=521003 RepID=C4F8B6_9ACTN|nr:hypothetical protein COLINT_02286 [Collinsella intestinalis DSM 13280]